MMCNSPVLLSMGHDSAGVRCPFGTLLFRRE